MLDLIVSVPDHCLSFYFLYHEYKEGQSEDEILTTGMKQLTGVMHDTFEIFFRDQGHYTHKPKERDFLVATYCLDK